jgi:ABC-type lipoprotein export system ATPase subunit|nr:MAG TPA: AAA domain protein [Caudoviricetes sp.]
MRLKSIEIHGFRNKDVVAKLLLSDGQFSFMYGKNGIGKTTFLELIYAIFNKNEKKMVGENVESVKIGFIDSKGYKEVYIWSYYEDNEIFYEWSDFDKSSLNEFNLLYITTQRALSEYRENITVDMLAYYLQNNKDITIDYLSPYHDLASLCNFINGMHDEQVMENIKDNNVCINSLRISDVGKLIAKHYFESRMELKILKSNVVSNILKICLDYLDEKEKYLKNPNGIIFRHSNQLSNSEEKILADLLENKADLVSRLVKSETNSGVAYSVTAKVKSELNKYVDSLKEIKSIEIFKLLTGKDIYVIDNDVKIKYKNEIHDLTKLSHGERHLLTLLFLIDFIGSSKKIILVDEPCIALDTDWQEKLVEIFSEITEVPFLIATHSPYISEDYLDDQIEILGGLK